MSDESGDRTFERWALIGAGVLAVAGIAAFLARRDPPDGGRADADGARDGDLLHVRIGGERPPPADLTRDEDAEGRRLAPDPPPVEPAPDPAPRSDTRRTVVVQPGETLGQIAQRELGSVTRLPELLELNGIADADRVRAGTELVLPAR